MASATLPAQNHVHINHQNTLIEGSFLIDVSLPGGFGKNLSLHNQNSLIEADVWVKGKAERCDIEAVNQNSWVKLTSEPASSANAKTPSRSTSSPRRRTATSLA